MKKESVKEITIEVPSGVTLSAEELAALLERFSIRVIDQKSHEVLLKIKQPPIKHSKV